MMVRHLITAAAITVFMAAVPLTTASLTTAHAQAPDATIFFSAVQDLPVMAGMTEAADGAVVFDQPDGRVAEVAATGPVDVRTVHEFYGAVLPQLGWRRAGAGLYTREREKLELEVVSDGGAGSVLRIQISPR